MTPAWVTEPEPVPPWWEFFAPEFPHWHVWRGVNGLLYAQRRLYSPPLTASAWTPEELAEEVRKLVAVRSLT